MPRLRLRMKGWANVTIVLPLRAHSCCQPAGSGATEKLPKLPFVVARFLVSRRLWTWVVQPSPCCRRPTPVSCWTDVRGMASAVFEGTSLVNMFVRDCWVNGIRRLIISQRGEEEEFYEIRTEWSDRNILYLHRSYSDLGRLFKRLVESFPEDRRDLSKSPLIEGWYEGKWPSLLLQHLLLFYIHLKWDYTRETANYGAISTHSSSALLIFIH